MRSATWKACAMMWVMMMTPMPCARTRSIISRPRRVCSTPSAAKGSSSSTSLPPQWTKRLSSIAWRWPPERCSTLVRSEGMRVPPAASALRGLRLHLALAQDRDAEDAARQLAAHEEIGDDVDIGAERQVLVDRLDAGRLGLGRRGEVALAARRRGCRPERRLQAAGDDLDQRRLAGAVVAEQRHDLAAVDRRS